MSSDPTDPLERAAKIEGPIKAPVEPQVGAGQADQAPFQMPTSMAPRVEAPSPMEVAAQPSAARLTAAALSERVAAGQMNLAEAQGKLNNPAIQKGLTPTHFEALGQVMGKMNGDLQTIAQSSDSVAPVPIKDGPKTVEQLVAWVNGAQDTFSGALQYLSETRKPDIASYMKMQYAIQRASQRAELFSSIVSSSVSGIKTLMSTQLG